MLNNYKMQTWINFVDYIVSSNRRGRDNLTASELR